MLQAGLRRLTFEAIVLRHPKWFSVEARNMARTKLAI